MKAFLALLERMEDQVLSGTDIPLTPWTVVHGDKLVHLLDRLRESLPDELAQAQQFMEKRDQLADEAQKRARQIVDEAKAQADLMLSESELMKAVESEARQVRTALIAELDVVRKQALEEAEMVRARAYEEARQISLGAERYAETVLSDLEKNLGEFQTVVKNGQSYLRQRKLDALHSRNAVRESVNRRQQQLPRDAKGDGRHEGKSGGRHEQPRKIPAPSQARLHKESMNLSLSDLFDQAEVLLPGHR
jgi:hypothetical protein